MRVEIHIDSLVVDDAASIGPAAEADLARQVGLALGAERMVPPVARTEQVATEVAAHVARAASPRIGGAPRSSTSGATGGTT